MELSSARKQLLVDQKQLSPEEMLNLTSELRSVLLLVYRLSDRRLMYSVAQLSSALGHGASAVHHSVEELIHPCDMDVFQSWLDSLHDSASFVPSCRCRFIGPQFGYWEYELVAEPNEGMNEIAITGKRCSSIKEQDNHEEVLSRLVLELQHSNKDLEEFAYVASHDLQEPLRKINNFSSRLDDRFSEILPEEARYYVQRIKASADNMRSLIDNLLEFSRVSRGRHTYSPVNLNFVLHQVLSELELTIEETNTKIESDSLPVIEASLPQIKQVFVNMIGNAIKFRKKDHPPRIEIRSELLPSTDRASLGLPTGAIYHKLTIQDNGIGFEPEYAETIFQVFQRLHGKTEYPGSGIGLAICRKIIEKHRGMAYATAAPGEGACFTLILPEKQSF